MIYLQYLFTQPNVTTGLDDIVVDTVTAVPSFVPLIFVFVFFVVFLGGVARQKGRTGTGDYAMWAVVASLSTLMVTLIMSIIEGLIRVDWLAIVITITIFSSVWLFLDRRQSEV